MFVIKVILATASFRFINAIIVDSYYTPSQTKEQIHAFQSVKANRPQERPREVFEKKEIQDDYVKPLYKYGYSVLDPYTLDVKSHWEHRDGDFVKGAYNMLEADGSMRIVEYISDKDIGFKAVVKKIPNYLKNERPVETFPVQKSKPNFPDQYYTPAKPFNEPYSESKPFNGPYSESKPFSGHHQHESKPSFGPYQSEGKSFTGHYQSESPKPYTGNFQTESKPFTGHQQIHTGPSHYSNNPFRHSEEDGHLNENYIQRENYYQQYQKKIKKQPINKFKVVNSIGMR